MALASSPFSQLYGLYPATANPFEFSLSSALMENHSSRLSHNCSAALRSSCRIAKNK
jgi:hypothetical protein